MKFAVAAALAIFSMPTTAVASTSAPIVSDAIDAMDQWAGGLVESGESAGLAILIAKDGKLVAERYYGDADREAGRPIGPDTIYRIQSMTKPVITAAILKLVEQGLLGLQDPIASYLPAFGSVRVYVSGDAEAMVTEPLDRPLTVHDLLTHTSGMTLGFLSDTPVDTLYRTANVFDDGDTTKARTAKIAAMPLIHQPGGVWHYSASFEVLGRLAEVVSGKPLATLLDEFFFAPMGMKDSGFLFEDAALARFASVYRRTDEGLTLLGDEGLSISLHSRSARMTSGGNGLAMTAQDYLTFASMLANRGVVDGKRILAEQSVKLMTSDQLLPEQNPNFPGGEGISFGYGGSVVIGPEAAPRAVGEYAWSGAAGTLFMVEPETGVAAVLMGQTIGANAWRNDFADQVHKLVKGQ